MIEQYLVKVGVIINKQGIPEFEEKSQFLSIYYDDRFIVTTMINLYILHRRDDRIAEKVEGCYWDVNMWKLKISSNYMNPINWEWEMTLLLPERMQVNLSFPKFTYRSR